MRNPWAARAWRRRRSVLRLHFRPEMGSPAVASSSTCSRAASKPGAFFDRVATRARGTDAPLIIGWLALEFTLPAPNGGATQAGDLGELTDTATPVVQGRPSDDLAAGFLVQAHQEPIERLMVLRHAAIGRRATRIAWAMVNLLAHGPYLLWSARLHCPGHSY